jgi:uncharacterized membrane protein YheB (UPF0754 family)
MKDFFFENIEIFKYLSIPLISGLIGWGTNVLALKMTFYPLEFKGIKPFLGWQGIIPAKAAKMASTAVDLWTSKLINVQDIFTRIDPEMVAKEMAPRFDQMAKDILDEIMYRESPALWDRVPQSGKQALYERLAKDMPVVVEKIMQDLKDNIDDVFDLKNMIVSYLTSNKSLMNEIFLKCGEKEFKFIEKSGFYFGFLFGLIQMAIWYYSDKQEWILPVAGLVVGFATNWLALKLIFEPINEKRILGFKFQGLFIKRQEQVAAEYSKMLAERILTPKHIFGTILNGPGKENFMDIITLHVNRSIDEAAGFSKSIVAFVAGSRKYDKLKEMAADKVIQELPDSINSMFDYAEDAMNLEVILRDKMQALSPEEFVDFLRPVFKEDELTLILVGAALGAAAGVSQLLLVFG